MRPAPRLPGSWTTYPPDSAGYGPRLSAGPALVRCRGAGVAADATRRAAARIADSCPPAQGCSYPRSWDPRPHPSSDRAGASRRRVPTLRTRCPRPTCPGDAGSVRDIDDELRPCANESPGSRQPIPPSA